MTGFIVWAQPDSSGKSGFEHEQDSGKPDLKSDFSQRFAFHRKCAVTENCETGKTCDLMENSSTQKVTAHGRLVHGKE